MRSAVRLFLLVIWSFAIVPAQLAALAISPQAARRVPAFYHRGVLRIFGISTEIAGQMRAARPTLFVGNHISYLDIFVLGAAIEGSFVAKADVAGWPVAGFFAKLQRTIFVERERRSSTGAQRDMMQKRMEAGDNLILFPEGTSHDGARVLQFKSALFSAAERRIDDKPVTVQPFSLAYIAMSGLPLTRAQRANVAWYGDMSLLPHIWQFLKANHTQAVIQFHPPVDIDAFGNRRLMATACHRTVASGVNRLVLGRNPAALPAPDDAAETAVTGAQIA